jgi:hypothetical protein
MRARGPVELANVMPSSAFRRTLGVSGTLSGGAGEGSLEVLDTLIAGAEAGALVGLRWRQELGAAGGALLVLRNLGLRRGGFLVRTVLSSAPMAIGGSVAGRRDGVAAGSVGMDGPAAGALAGVDAGVLVGI